MTCFLKSKGKEEHDRKLYDSRCYFTHQEFLNLGILSSFQVSVVENRDATAHPLQKRY
jgi:hypothetical protein